MCMYSISIRKTMHVQNIRTPFIVQNNALVLPRHHISNLPLLNFLEYDSNRS